MTLAFRGHIDEPKKNKVRNSYPDMLFRFYDDVTVFVKKLDWRKIDWAEIDGYLS